MPFCTNCGTKVSENDQFCTNCGAVINQNFPHTSNKRETVYEGKIHKCPNCGEPLNSFVACCPACGYELRGRAATYSVQSFYNDLSRMQTTAQKSQLIRNFPIPNAKEDVIEFMILASSNIIGEDEKEIYESWLAKFEQVYQKALILFNGDPDLDKIQQIYDNCQTNIDSEKQRKLNRFTADTVIRNIAVCIGVALMIVAIIVDRSGGNASLMELVSYVVLIASASSLFKRGACVVDYLVGIASGALILLLSFLLSNGSMGQLCGGIVLIIVGINYFKSLGQPKK